jgi:hypothetical protein
LQGGWQASQGGEVEEGKTMSNIDVETELPDDRIGVRG